MSLAPLVSTGPLPERPELSPARRRLFETALEQFGRDGYNGVSVRDIARELNQQPTAIYAHVSSKQDLLYQLVLIAHEELRDRLRSALLDAGREPIDQLRAIISANIVAHLEMPDLARVSHAEHSRLTEENRAIIDVLRRDVGQLLRDIVQRGIERGIFDPPQLDITLLAISTMGVRVVDWWTPESGLSIAEVAKTHADLAVRMLT